MSSKTFDHLKNIAQVEKNPVEASSQVFEAKLQCEAFARDEATWIEYYCFMKGNSEHLAAKRVLERALEKVMDKQRVIANCT